MEVMFPRCEHPSTWWTPYQAIEGIGERRKGEIGFNDVLCVLLTIPICMPRYCFAFLMAASQSVPWLKAPLVACI